MCQVGRAIEHHKLAACAHTGKQLRRCTSCRVVKALSLTFEITETHLTSLLVAICLELAS